MTIRLLTLLTALVAITSLASARMGDVSCDDSARLANMLTKVLGAERHGTGLRDPETMVEVWVTRASGEWMIVQNYANGTSCIVAMGEHWQTTNMEPA